MSGSFSVRNLINLPYKENSFLLYLERSKIKIQNFIQILVANLKILKNQETAANNSKPLNLEP